MKQKIFLFLYILSLLMLGCKVEVKTKGDIGQQPNGIFKGSLSSLVVMRNSNSPIGTNPGGLSAYGTTWPVVNLIKGAENWGHAEESSSGDWCWGSGGPLESRDDQGNVSALDAGQFAYTRLLWGLSKEQMPTHRGDIVKITVLYKGHGKLTYHYYAEDSDCWNAGDRDKTILKVERYLGRDVVYMDSNDMASRGITRWGLRVRIESTEASNYIKDLKVLPPGGVCENDGTRWCENSSDCLSASCLSFEGHSDDIVFHPSFIKQNAKYSTIRLMNWVNPNSDNHGVSWNDRAKVDDARWNIKGTPWEILFLLANRLSTNIWINLPLRAVPQDSLSSKMIYAEELGKLASISLNENLTVHLETGNEVWGDQLATLGSKVTDVPSLVEGTPCEQGANNNDWGAWSNHCDNMIGVVEASKKSCEGFKLHFDSLKMKCVLPTQSGFFGRSTFMLKYLEHKYGAGNVRNHFDILSPASYFGSSDSAWKDAATESAQLSALLVSVANSVNSSENVKNHVDLAKTYGLRVDAYEGGQHLVEFDNRDITDVSSRAYISANLAPEMKPIYMSHLLKWKDSGAGLFMHFTTTGRQANWSGSWGSIDNYNVDCGSVSKCSALQLFIDQNVPWY